MISNLNRLVGNKCRYCDEPYGKIRGEYQEIMRRGLYLWFHNTIVWHDILNVPNQRSLDC